MTDEQFSQAISFWTKKDQGEKRLNQERLSGWIDDFLSSHKVLALAVSTRDFIRCTPLEYSWHDGALWIFTEGGMKFKALQENRHGAAAIFDPDPSFGGLKSIQVEGNIDIIDPFTDEYNSAAAFRKIPLETLKKLAEPMWLLKLVPEEMTCLNSEFKKNGYGTRQIWRSVGERAGTVRIETERLVLRKHVIEDADLLHDMFGADEKMFEYSGWNPYETREMARETIQGFMDKYDDEFFFGWAIESNGDLIGTIGAYDYNEELDSIEIGISIDRRNWGKGYGTEALKAVLEYLTDNKKIKVVKAWCASNNMGSKKIMEKCGMQLTSVDPSALSINGRTFDKLNYEYRAN